MNRSYWIGGLLLAGALMFFRTRDPAEAQYRAEPGPWVMLAPNAKTLLAYLYNSRIGEVYRVTSGTGCPEQARQGCIVALAAYGQGTPLT